MKTNEEFLASIYAKEKIARKAEKKKRNRLIGACSGIAACFIAVIGISTGGIISLGGSSSSAAVATASDSDAYMLYSEEMDRSEAAAAGSKMMTSAASESVNAASDSSASAADEEEYEGDELTSSVSDNEAVTAEPGEYDEFQEARDSMLFDGKTEPVSIETVSSGSSVTEEQYSANTEAQVDKVMNWVAEWAADGLAANSEEDDADDDPAWTVTMTYEDGSQQVWYVMAYVDYLAEE